MTTPIIPLRVIDDHALWRRFLAGVLVGIAFGVMITQSPAEPPVGIAEVVVRVGQHLCHANEGLKTIYRHGRASSVYSFHCNDQAEFNEIPVTQQPLSSKAIVNQPEDWR